jgi:hypothetical protein
MIASMLDGKSETPHANFCQALALLPAEIQPIHFSARVFSEDSQLQEEILLSRWIAGGYFVFCIHDTEFHPKQ